MELEVAKVGLRGTVVSWEVINPDGSIATACYTPKHNLILDVGLDMIGNLASIPVCFAYLALGTGTSESTTNMTGLETETTYGSTTRPPASGYTAYNSITIPAADANPFIVIYQTGIQTAVGKLNGTFTELGLGPTDTKNANLWSRFRIKDSDGNPTSVAIAADQQLRLKYQLSVRFLPIVPTAYECEITGYDVTFGYTAGWQGLGYFDTLYNVTSIFKWFGTTSLTLAISISTVTATPITFQPLTTITQVTLSGAQPSTALTRDAYISSSYANYINVLWTTLEALGNIYGIQGWVNNYYAENHFTIHWLCAFDTPINKPDTHNLSFKLKFSWGRDS